MDSVGGASRCASRVSAQVLSLTQVRDSSVDRGVANKLNAALRTRVASSAVLRLSEMLVGFLEDLIVVGFIFLSRRAAVPALNKYKIISLILLFCAKCFVKFKKIKTVNFFSVGQLV